MRASTLAGIARKSRWPRSLLPIGVWHTGIGPSRLKTERWIITILVIAVVGFLGCDSAARTAPETSPTSGTPGVQPQEVTARFLVGGWVVPKGEDVIAQPFAEALKAFVITSEQELRNFLDGLDLTRVRGSLEPLNQADFGKVVVIGTYYLWRPLKGDPLSLEKVELVGTNLEVSLELLEDPQGRESPYLMAPLNIVALEREDLPRGVPINLAFRVNGKVAATEVITLD